MTTTTSNIGSSDSSVKASQSILSDLTSNLGPREFAVRFHDGTVWEAETDREPTFTIVLPYPSSVRSMFWPPGPMTLGEAYVYGDFDVEGDMYAFIVFLRWLEEQPRSPRLLASLARRLWLLPAEGRQPRTGSRGARLKGRQHSKARDRQAISFHYDTSNEFFALFLDPRMVYTCAYFSSEDDSLAEAQEKKLDYICRKLRLEPGERFLDIGCGWGGLVTYAAEHYGVDATGVTLSRAQAEFAQEEIRRRGLEGRCRVEYRDYRDVPSDEPFDKIATVEVLEHFEDYMMPVYFKKMQSLLRPGGSLYVQAITLTGPRAIVKWRKFILRYIFPDGRLRPVSIIQREAEKHGFEVRDVESLREHYIKTLAIWLESLEAKRDQAIRVCDEFNYRAFRIYLAGAQYGYTTSGYNLHQTLYVKPHQGKSGYPATRAEWYTADEPQQSVVGSA